MENCLFCKIIKGEIPARKVFEDDRLVVIEDIAPVAPVHLLIIPRRHVVNALDLDPADDTVPVALRVIRHAVRVLAEIRDERLTPLEVVAVDRLHRQRRQAHVAVAPYLLLHGRALFEKLTDQKMTSKPGQKEQVNGRSAR